MFLDFLYNLFQTLGKVFPAFLSKCLNLTFDQICPIVIPTESLNTNIVIAYNHVNSVHISIHYTRSKLRNRYWIPKDTPIMKSVLNKCQVCFDQTSQRYHVPDNPNLPEFRLDSKYPGKTTFLDKTNHYFIKDKHCNTEKVYLILSVCASAGLGPIGMAGNLAAEVFAYSLEKFCSRNALPFKIVFVCASAGPGPIEMAENASTEALTYSFERFCSKNALPFKIVSVQGNNVRAFNIELKIISGEITKNLVLIKDNSKDFRIGNIIELIKSDDGEIR